MSYGVRFVTNFPRRSRPRGLGYASDCAQNLSGLGSWVVDTEYGLGPRFREGYNRPYPPESMPTRYPRAQAARVLGQGAGVNVVARPFASTRLATTRYPVRMAPVTAPGARLRNPGVAGFGGVTDAFFAASDLAYAGGQANVIAPAAIGIAANIAGRTAGLTGGPRNMVGLAALAGLGLAALNFYRNWQDAREASKDVGVAAAGKRVGASVSKTAKEITAKPPETVSDQEKRQVLLNYACYENARRAKESASWFEKATGTGNAIRNPLVDCGLNAEQLSHVKRAFATISREDRARLVAAYGEHGSLKDLGPYA